MRGDHCADDVNDLVCVVTDSKDTSDGTFPRSGSEISRNAKRDASENRYLGESHLNQQIPKNPSPYSEDVYASFTVVELFRGAPYDQEYSHQSWVKETLLCKANSLPYLAFQCLAAACFGRMHGPSQEVLAQAAILYGHVLLKLRDAIEDPATRYGQFTLSATMSLHLYELICNSSGSGWVKHAGGAGRLIELRGPSRHQEWPDHGYFTLLRPRIVLQAIVSRKRTFLEKDEWLTVPWKIHPETKTPHQQLLDIMTPIAGLLEDLNVVRRSAKSQMILVQLYQGFIPRYQNLLERLLRWRWTWEERNPNVAKVVRPSRTMDPNGRPPYDAIFHFKSLVLAHEINVYNAAFMLLRNGLCIMQDHTGNTDAFAEAFRKSLSDRNGKPPPKTNALTYPHEFITSVEIASDIARSVEYYLQQQHSNHGAFHLLVPLRMCILAYSLADDQDILRWIVGLQLPCAAQTAFESTNHMSRLARLGIETVMKGLDARIMGPSKEVDDREISE